MDFVPEENFSWDFDLEAAANKGKKKKKNAALSHVVVIKQNQTVNPINQRVKLKLKEDIEFSMTDMDKVNKGFTNSTNCCYMNVCLQSLISSPPFFNMLLAIDSN